MKIPFVNRLFRPVVEHRADYTSSLVDAAFTNATEGQPGAALLAVVEKAASDSLQVP